jgi:cell division protein FtsB
MAGFGKKKTITEYLYTKPVIFVLLLVCIFLSVSVYNRYTVEREMSLRRTEAQEKKQELLERKKTLEERVNYLGGDRGIEEEIRTHFDVAKEGEKVFILTGEEKKEVQEVAPVVEERPWYKFW